MADRWLLLFEVDGILVTHAESGDLIRMPGSWEILAQLQHRSDAVPTVATRLSEEDGRAKLAEVTGTGLERYMDLDAGAYGTDATTAGARIVLARRRARERYGCAFTVMAIVGSTDDAVASAADADVVTGVVTPRATAEELRAAGVTNVVEKLTELAPLVLAAQVR